MSSFERNRGGKRGLADGTLSYGCLGSFVFLGRYRRISNLQDNFQRDLLEMYFRLQHVLTVAVFNSYGSYLSFSLEEDFVNPRPALALQVGGNQRYSDAIYPVV